MKKTVGFDFYLQCLRKSGLIENSRLKDILQDLDRRSPSGQCRDLEIIGERLISEGLITDWQNGKLKNGLATGFFIGKYKLLRRLGKGGMSRVYLAVHKVMEHQAAVKILDPRLTESRSYLERFYRESKITASLKHDNIVKAYDVDSEDRFHFIVMEYVDGKSFSQLIRERRMLPYDLAAEYVRQAAEGLHYGHQKGLVHRDIKPGNLLLTHEGRVIILDFGLSRLTSTEAESLTLKYNEGILGTIDYLAPEQAMDSHTVDFYADIYSLGCTLYALLTGRPPFYGGTKALRIMKHQTDPPPPLTLTRPDIPKDLEAICLRMIEKNPVDRFASAGEVAEALQEWLDSTRKDRIEDATASVIINEEDSNIASVSIASTIYGAETPAEIRIHIRCPYCKARFATNGNAKNRKARCPSCEKVILIPKLDMPASWQALPEGFEKYGCPEIFEEQDYMKSISQSAKENQESSDFAMIIIRKLSDYVQSENASRRSSLLEVFIEALAINNSDLATNGLAQILFGRIRLGKFEKMALHLTVAALIEHLDDTREQLLVDTMIYTKKVREGVDCSYSNNKLKKLIAKSLLGCTSKTLPDKIATMLNQPDLTETDQKLLDKMASRLFSKDEAISLPEGEAS